MRNCFILLVFAFSSTQAQKNILISDTLAAHAQKLEVKLGTQWFGKTFQIRFGEYAIVSSKMGWTTGNSKTNLFGTKIQSNSSEKFSFILTNAAHDSATVNAAKNVHKKELSALQILPNVSIGLDETEELSKNFTALITTRDTSITWTLVILQSKEKDGNETRSAILTSGERKIELRPASSAKPGEKPGLPARGYEFFENGRSLGALQYLGSGMLGLNKNFAWIRSDIDDQMKLVLAAVMSAIFQLKGANPEG